MSYVIINKKSPFEVLFSRLPDYSALKVFGCACYPYLRPYQSQKFQFQSTKCLFLGYSDSHNGSKWLAPSARLCISCHITFNEEEFPFLTDFANTRNATTDMPTVTPLVSSSYCVF